MLILLASDELSMRDAVLTVSPNRQSAKKEESVGSNVFVNLARHPLTARVLGADDVGHNGTSVEAHSDVDTAAARLALVNQGGLRRLDGIQRKQRHTLRVVLLLRMQVRHCHVRVACG